MALAGFINAGLGHGADTSARFNVTVRLTAPSGSVRVSNPSTEGAQISDAHTLSMPGALTVKASGGVPCRLRFRIIDPAVMSVLVLGLAHPVRVTTGAIDAVVPANSGNDLGKKLSLLVQYRGEVRERLPRAPIEVTLLP
jgi:hypothetical protein